MPSPEKEAAFRRNRAEQVRAVRLATPWQRDVQALIERARSHMEQAANIAAAAMLDRLTDDQAVADMHNVIGCLASARDSLELIGNDLTKEWQYHSAKFGGDVWFEADGSQGDAPGDELTPEAEARRMATDKVRSRWVGPWHEEEARPDGRS
jgi:hypothetical protein